MPALGRLAMAVGVCLVVGGLGLRMGVIALPPAGDLPVVGAASSGPAGTSTPTAPTAASTLLPSATPDATTLPGAVWFADDFDAVAAWPTGDLGGLTAKVVDGRYRIDAQATDLPVVVVAAAGDGSPETDAAVSVRLAFAPTADPDAAAGIALETNDGTRFLILLAASGRVTVYRDSIESLDGLASGTAPPPTGLVELRVTASAGTLSATVGSTPVVSARASVAPVAVGLAVWAPGGPVTVDVDRYEVWLLAGDG